MLELSIIILTVCAMVFLLIPRHNKRHKKYISTSAKVIEKINSFTGENKGERIFSYLRKINPYVFEELLLTSLKTKGFDIQRNKRYSGDGGIDGKAFLNGTLYLIQAKRYKHYVSKKHLEAFYNLVGNDKKGLFIHTGKTGKATFQKYRSSNITIISGNSLIKLIQNK
jgi:restriction system protein